jgi:exosortase O
VHLPLGVFGFVVACALAVFLVRRLPAHGPAGKATPARPLGVGLWPLSALLLTLATGSAHGEAPARAVGRADIRLPAAWQVTPLPLDEKAARLFTHHGGAHAGKWRFQAGQATGMLLVVVADSFRAHHAPETCLAGAGHTIDGVRRVELGPGRPLRLIEVDGHRVSAATWFQSARTTTDSLMQRTLAELTGREQRWALVSVLFDGAPRFDPASRALLEDLHAAVAASLASSDPKGT